MVPLGVYIVGIIVFLLSLIFLRFYQWRKDLPPGPACLPFIGNIGMVDLSDTVAEFRRLRRKYGDVFCFVMGSRPVVVVNGLEALREIFVKNADVTSVRPADFYLSKLSNWKGIVPSNGVLWKEQRAFALKTLRDFGFGKRSLESQIQPHVETLLRIMGDTNGETFNIKENLKFCIANVVCSITMGRTYDFNDENMAWLLTYIEKSFSDNAHRGIVSYLPFREYIPGDPFHAKSRTQLLGKIRTLLRGIIDEHKRSMDKENVRDYVDAYLIEQESKSTDSNSTFDDEQLMMTLRDFFVAGHETIVTALSWIILRLIHHPEIQTRIRNEIVQAVGTSRLPSLFQRDELPYTEAFITETMRLNAVTPLAGPHGTLSDVYWKGYRIPVGTHIIPNLSSVLMDPKIFPNPEKFEPERFLDTEGKVIRQHVLIPFGVGPRVCVGESLARMEILLFTAAIVQRFQILPEDPSNLPSLKGVLGITCSPVPYNIRAISQN